jgi:thioredoxin-like negative regulator of GroEL
MTAIFFTSKICPACQKMAPVIKKLTEDGYQIETVDTRNDTKLAKQFKIDSIPVLIILEDQKEIKRLIGIVSEIEIRNILKKSSDYRIW